VILSPVLYPIAAKFGIDPYHFSMIVGVNLVLGLITPPVAISLSIVSVIAGAPSREVTREVMPFLFAAFVGAAAHHLRARNQPRGAQHAGRQMNPTLVPRSLDGRVALVFGAGSSGPGWGNGKATAVTFARAGATVIAIDINAAAAEEDARPHRRRGRPGRGAHLRRDAIGRRSRRWSTTWRRATAASTCCTTTSASR
jgi:hypothetical protein